MIIKKVVIATVISLFVWQSVADAASISTRVRILESKVAKQDKKIKASTRAQQESLAKVDKSLKRVQQLEKKVAKLLKDQKKAKAGPKTDKRYAFP